MSGHHAPSSDQPRAREGIALLIALVAVGLFFWLGTLQKETELTVVVTPTGAKVRLLEPAPIGVEIEADLVATSGRATFAHLPVGRTARVTVSAPGYRQTVVDRVLADGENRLEVRLSAEMPLITIVTEPVGAQVFVDNRARGPAPLVLDDLTMGPHRVSARLAGHLPAERDVVVQAGQDQKIDLVLTPEAGEGIASPEPVVEEKPIPPGYGRVIITSNKPATLLVDNQIIGQGSKVTRDVLAGPHLLGCIAEGFGIKTNRSEIIEGEVEQFDCVYDEDRLANAMKMLDPSTAFYWTTKGAQTRNEGQYGTAVEMFKKALEIDPDYAEAHRQLGYTLPGMKRFEEAAEHLEKYIELNPHAPNLEFAREMIEVYHREMEKEGQ